MTPELLGIVADRFKVLSEPARLEILSTLRHGEHTVSELVEATGFGQANVSKHLQLLFSQGFVDRRKEGVSVYYRLADKRVFQLCEIMCDQISDQTSSRRRALAS